MLRNIFNRRYRRVIAAVMLLALLFQGAIPTGFMPAEDGSLSLKICHGGMPDKSGTHHVDFCPFGASATFAPLPQLIAFAASAPITSHLSTERSIPAPYFPLERAHPARGPPIPA
jgi:hypothetical protein